MPQGPLGNGALGHRSSPDFFVFFVFWSLRGFVPQGPLGNGALGHRSPPDFVCVFVFPRLFVLRNPSDFVPQGKMIVSPRRQTKTVTHLGDIAKWSFRLGERANCLYPNIWHSTEKTKMVDHRGGLPCIYIYIYTYAYIHRL